MKKVRSVTSVLILCLIVLVTVYSSLIPNKGRGFVALDPGSGGGSGDGFEFCRMWRYDYDIQDDEATGVRKVYFEASNDLNLRIERFDPYGNIWIRSWITEDDATITENWNGQSEYYRLYLNKQYHYTYPSHYKGNYVGISGGFLTLNDDTGIICPAFGATLKFQIGIENYQEPYEYFSNDIDEHPYSFFGSEPAPTWCCHVLFPSGAWYCQY